MFLLRENRLITATRTLGSTMWFNRSIITRVMSDNIFAGRRGRHKLWSAPLGSCMRLTQTCVRAHLRSCERAHILFAFVLSKSIGAIAFLSRAVCGKITRKCFLSQEISGENFYSWAGCGTLDSKGIYKGAFDAEGHDANAFASETGLAGGNLISFL
jgi:hypothetical protein